MKSPDRDAADELLPCPFCGSPAWFDDRLAIGDHAAECTECRCSTKLVECNHDAAAIWNRRTEASELATLRRRVAEMEADKTAMPVSGGSMYCGKCNQWLADGRRLLWHPASGKYYCIGCDPASPLPPGRNEG